MTIEGNEVYTSDTFDCREVEIGVYVTEELVDDMINCLPPASMSSQCSQLGEPMAHKVDPKTGKIRPLYMTFKRHSKDVWIYCGYCFRGENSPR